MKKTVKTSKKQLPRKKTVKMVNAKRIKSVGTARKRPKTGCEAMTAFRLAAVLVVLSLCISFAAITVHSNFMKAPLAADPNSEPAPVTSVESGPEENLAPSVPAEPADTQPPVFEPGDLPVVVSVRQPSEKNQTAVSARTATETSTSFSASSRRQPEKPPENSAVNLGTLVFVIDDAGNNLRELEPFLRIAGPLTVAVLPGLPYSAEAARRARAAGKEVILHQPMEALGGQNPGPGAIYNSMSVDEVRAVLSRNIAEVGPVAGINNHQGSKITMDSEMMETILTFCAEHGLFFLDSRTTAETAVPAAARRLGMKIAERDIFIDNEQNKEAMLGYIAGGLARAQKNGSAVMIGHAWSPDLAPLLDEQFQFFTKQGYTIKTASDIIKER